MPVVKKLLDLLKFRNTSDAFELEGSIEIQTPSESKIIIHRKNQENSVVSILEADLETKEFVITENGITILEQ